ncbi:MAG: patatin-like phospholipase family protein [Chloroflexota bacterium]
MNHSEQNQPSVSVVLGSGSVKCSAALGMFHVLEREGIDVDLIVGGSAGSIFGTLLAMGMTAKEAEVAATRLWTPEVTKKRSRRSLLSILFPKQLGFDEKFGMLDDTLIQERLQQALGDKQFTDTTIPLYITATDFHTGEMVVLQEGKLRDAIRASISIPFMFKPYKVNGLLLIDGFMSDSLPIAPAIQNGGNIILAMGFETAYNTQFRHIGHFASQMTSIMKNNLLKARFAFNTAVHHEEVIPILPALDKDIKRFDIEKIPHIIAEGERATEAQLPYIRRLLESKLLEKQS